MSSSPGTRLGAYEIAGPLGKGGMGEVFRARDTRLGREVALKLLPEGLARDGARIARFKREAHVLASLNHPNIGAIYGLEDEGGGRLALVLELVPGDTLEDRLRRGAIPVDEAIGIAKQVAAALEEAHERGVVHRDLKPSNVKVAEDGRVKVLDFGLAKALLGDEAGAAPDLSTSPTLTRPTEEGLILGTAAYMAPEQARGKAVDKRADIWAFGVVLFEMLTGRRLFLGETVSDTLAAVLTKEPDWNALPAATPPAVQRLLRRCLTRDPRQRLHDAGDARLELEAESPREPAAVTKRGSARLAWAAASVAGLLAALAMAWALWTHGGSGPARQATYIDIGYPHGVEPLASLDGGFALSPDGRSVVLIGIRNGVRRLFLRRLDQPEAVEIPETQDADSVAFSPDGGSIAFVRVARGGLIRLSLADRERRPLATGVDQASALTWSSSGIVYPRRGSLRIVSADGGAPRALTTLDPTRHEAFHADPLVLPGGRTLLFTSFTTQPGSERIEAVPLAGGPRSVVLERAMTPIWSPTGHLLFGRDGAVLAAAFDADRALLRGAAVPVIPEGVVGRWRRSATLGLRLSAVGTLAFLPADVEYNRVVSVGRDGAALTLQFPPGRYANPRLSPDGTRLLIESSGASVEVLDMTRGTQARLAAAAPGTNFPIWSRDGGRVVLRRYNSPVWVAADGSGNEGPVSGTLITDFPTAPGPDADSVLLVRVHPETTSGDIVLASLSGSFEPRPLVATRAYEGGAELSPDGRFLVYQSNESGEFEIQVRRYPALDRSWQVSDGGGVQARWHPRGREIFYRNGRSLMAVPFDGSAAEPSFGKPIPVFADDYEFGQGRSRPNYDVTADGRFIMVRRESHAGAVRAVLDWTAELKRILANAGVR